MRRIGNLTDRQLAERFCDYLVTLAIDASADERLESPTDSGAAKTAAKTWDIWIRDEKDVDKARGELDQFEQNPHDAKYQASNEAARIRDEKAAEDARRRKNVVSKPKWSDSAGSGSAALAGARVRQQGIPVTIGIIVISVICGFGANFSSPRRPLDHKIYNAMTFVERSDFEDSRGDAFASIRKGEVWRIVTPMFMHGDQMHLAFNMLMMFFLGSLLERLHGSMFLIVLAIVSHVIGILLQVMLPGVEELPWLLSRFAGSSNVVGASGAVCGLFGFLWVRPMIDPTYPVRMAPMNVAFILGWLVFCTIPFTGFDLHVANGAHLGGLATGMLVAPLLAKRET